jgi:hypothetical protein
MPRGRPPLTEEVVRQRIADHCGRYQVGLNPDGLPVYPAGRRESPEHREWIVLYKAFSRVQARQRLADRQGRESLFQTQNGHCPVCAEPVEATAALDRDPSAGRVRGLVHEHCARLVRLAEDAGPDTVRRLGPYLWPDQPARRR